MSPLMSWAPAWEGLDALIDQKRERLGKIIEKHELYQVSKRSQEDGGMKSRLDGWKSTVAGGTERLGLLKGATRSLVWESRVRVNDTAVGRDR